MEKKRKGDQTNKVEQLKKKFGIYLVTEEQVGKSLSKLEIIDEKTASKQIEYKIT